MSRKLLKPSLSDNFLLKYIGWQKNILLLQLLIIIYTSMSTQAELIELYTADLKEKCGVAAPDVELLTKVTKGLGPSIYNNDASKVSGSDKTELELVKNNFLIKKLGLADTPELDTAIDKVLEQYGKSNKNKYRAVVYYLLTKHFGKESVYND